MLFPYHIGSPNRSERLRADQGRGRTPRRCCKVGTNFVSAVAWSQPQTKGTGTGDLW